MRNKNNCGPFLMIARAKLKKGSIFATRNQRFAKSGLSYYISSTNEVKRDIGDVKYQQEARISSLYPWRIFILNFRTESFNFAAHRKLFAVLFSSRNNNFLQALPKVSGF